jgi:DNA gyrase subunit A
MERFELSEIQAQAILDMQLRRLAALERQRIQDEYDELQTLIAELEAILADPRGSARSSRRSSPRSATGSPTSGARASSPTTGAMTVEDLIPGRRRRRHPDPRRLRQAHPGRRVPDPEARRPGRARDRHEGGRHRVGPPDLLDPRPPAVLHQPGPRLPHQGLPGPGEVTAAKGVYVANVPGLALEQDEKVAAVMALASSTDDRYLVFATKQGTVKRTRLDDFDSPRSVLIAINLATTTS